MPRKKIKVTQPNFIETDTVGAIDLLKRFWMTQSKEVYNFETEFAKYVGRKHAIAVNSGSSAILVMVSALKHLGYIKEGERVSVPALGWITTLAPLFQLNLKPVFLDVHLDGKHFLTMDTSNADTDAIFPISFLGFPVESRKYLLVDNCNSLKTYNGMVESFSFFASHHITTGEGGMIVTDNDKIAQVCRSLREYGNKCKARCDSPICKTAVNPEYLCPNRRWRFEFDYLGYNLKMTDVAASVGREQLKRADMFIKRRKENAKMLSTKLAKFSFIRVPKYNDDAHWFTYPIISLTDREKLMKFMADNHIETRYILGGDMTKQDALKKQNFEAKDLPNTEYINKNAFIIGCHPNVSKEDIDYIVETLERFKG